MTAFPFLYVKDSTPSGKCPHIEAEFLTWVGGFESRVVARVRLRITGKTKKRTVDVTLRRWSKIVGDGDINFAVFSVGRLVPPAWRQAALDITHAVCAKQWDAERKARQQGGRRV